MREVILLLRRLTVGMGGWGVGALRAGQRGACLPEGAPGLCGKWAENVSGSSERLKRCEQGVMGDGGRMDLGRVQRTGDGVDVL